MPPFGAREIIAIISSLSTCDPGNIQRFGEESEEDESEDERYCHGGGDEGV